MTSSPWSGRILLLPGGMVHTQHGANLGGVRRWLFEHVVRHRMNRRVSELRARGSSALTGA